MKRLIFNEDSVVAIRVPEKYGWSEFEFKFDTILYYLVIAIQEASYIALIVKPSARNVPCVIQALVDANCLASDPCNQEQYYALKKRLSRKIYSLRWRLIDPFEECIKFEGGFPK